MGEMKCLGFSQQKLNVNNCACWYLHPLHLPPCLYSICCSHMKEFIFCKIKNNNNNNNETNSFNSQESFRTFRLTQQEPLLLVKLHFCTVFTVQAVSEWSSMGGGTWVGATSCPQLGWDLIPCSPGAGRGMERSCSGNRSSLPPPPPAPHLHLHATELSSLSYHCVVLL